LLVAIVNTAKNAREECFPHSECNQGHHPDMESMTQNDLQKREKLSLH
jgi:hypothetical protein